MRRRVLLTSLGVALAGCSDAGSGGATEPTTDGRTETSATTDTMTASAGTETESETESESESGTTTRTGTATRTDTVTATATETAALTVEVAPDGRFRFSPESVEVGVGETVRWVWRSGGHNVVAASTPDGSDWAGTPDAPDALYDAGYEYDHTFEVAGTYEYYCAPHKSLGMTGTVSVTQ